MVEHKWEHTNNTKHVYEYEQCKVMQDIRERVERKYPSANTRICFEVLATALRSRLHTERFSLCPPKTLHKETSTEELQRYKPEYTTPSLNTITSTKEGAQSKERNALGDSNDHK